MICGRGNPPLFQKVFEKMGVEKNGVTLGNFEDREVSIQIHFEPLNKEIVILQVK